jgi:hypothetical protein
MTAKFVLQVIFAIKKVFPTTLTLLASLAISVFKEQQVISTVLQELTLSQIMLVRLMIA